MSQEYTNIGIDVSKKGFDVFMHESQAHKTFKMTSNDIRKATLWIKESNPKIIVLEATGGYEYPLVAEFASASLPLAVINPRQIRDFAKAIGQLAKTDKIDSTVLARYAAVISPDLTNVLSKAAAKIKNACLSPPPACRIARRRKESSGTRPFPRNHAKYSLHHSKSE